MALADSSGHPKYCQVHRCRTPACSHPPVPGKLYCHEHCCAFPDCPNSVSALVSSHGPGQTAPTSALPKYCPSHQCRTTSCMYPAAPGKLYCHEHGCSFPDCPHGAVVPSLPTGEQSRLCPLHRSLHAHNSPQSLPASSTPAPPSGPQKDSQAPAQSTPLLPPAFDAKTVNTHRSTPEMVDALPDEPRPIRHCRKSKRAKKRTKQGPPPRPTYFVPNRLPMTVFANPTPTTTPEGPPLATALRDRLRLNIDMLPQRTQVDGPWRPPSPMATPKGMSTATAFSRTKNLPFNSSRISEGDWDH
jgi:hypothetical protein